jgi:hypothetical protein
MTKKSPHSGRTKNISPFELLAVSWEELQKDNVFHKVY